ncbi:MAG: GC-type dockerin domain-anchored protein, partial [Planctomycetota bacterium]
SAVFDRITGNAASLNVDGSLELGLRAGFVPSLGSRFAIIDAASIVGEFLQVNTPTIDGRLFRIIRSHGDIEVLWTCEADANLDGMLSTADFNSWVLAFNDQSPVCDQNGDGMCTIGDFNAWILNFNSGC